MPIPSQQTSAPEEEPATHPLTVAVLGATGGTGRLVVRALLRRGHAVKTVSRSAFPVPDDGTRVTSVTGDLADAAFLRSAFAGCGAVISCLGHNHKSKRLWSKRTSPADLLQTVARATVAALGRDSPKPYVYVSAFGVGDDLPKHTLLFRVTLRLIDIGDAYRDHAEAERVIKASGTRWTIVRPPGLTDRDTAVRLVDRGDAWTSFDTVSRRSVADYLVSCVEDGRLVGRVVTVGEPR